MNFDHFINLFAQFILNIWLYIKELEWLRISTIFSNVMVGSVPLIVGWMRYFSTNIKILGQAITTGTFYGESYSIKLENKTLRSFVIDKINVYINKEQFFTISLEKLDFEKRTIDPFKQLIIEERWTFSTQSVDILLFNHNKFEIFTSGKRIKINNSSFIRKLMKLKIIIKLFNRSKSLSIRNEIGLNKIRFNDQVVSKNIKFAIHLFNTNGGFERSILVCDNGFMNDNILVNGVSGCNMLPKDKVYSSEILISFLKHELNWSYRNQFMIQSIGNKS